MSNQLDLLIEIGTEELPPRALASLSDAFSRGVFDGLAKASLIEQYDSRDYASVVKSFATPRRLAVLIKNVITTQTDSAEPKFGPAIKAAKADDGSWTKAALGFARSCGVAADALEIENERLVYTINKKGLPAKDLIPDIVEAALAALPIPKPMRWGSSSVEFVRPVHWVLMLLGKELVSGTILGITSARETRGHRFHHPDSLSIPEPGKYEALLLEQGHVVADRVKRRETIKDQVIGAARKLQGEALISDALLDEVTALVEWPVVISGSFDPRFLEVPREALVSSMQSHQKCFPVVGASGKLMPNFIAIANIDSKDPAQVLAGNERVMRPRLADAAFFWEQDCKHQLADHLDALQKVTFQNKLGSVWDKTQRVSSLAGVIAKGLGANPEHAKRAGLLAKCDLLTYMVGEFPELQGVMGRYYAAKDGEHSEVSQAIDEQYMPRFAGDSLPETVTGQAVAIADKLDTLVGIFGIGQLPSGNKDPFALRRAALGALRIFIERDLDLDLTVLLQASVQAYGNLIDKDTAAQVFSFMMERLRAYYLDDGIPYDSIDAVLACQPEKPSDFNKRVRAVSSFRALPESESLAAANKRIRNILKKTDEEIPASVDNSVLVEDAEKLLAEQLSAFSKKVEPLFAVHDYTPALTTLTGLRKPVDAFFDDVMVMTDDKRLRTNRLALLSQLSALFLRVADISKLEQ